MVMVTLIMDTGMAGVTLTTDMVGAILIIHITAMATDAAILTTTIIIPIIQVEEDPHTLMEQMEDILKATTGILKVTTEPLITTPEIAHHLPIEIILNRKMALQTAIIHPVEQETIQVLKATEVQTQAVVLEITTIQVHQDLTVAQAQAATVVGLDHLMEVVHTVVEDHTAEAAEDHLVVEVVEEDNRLFFV
jgi:hypothetical protein